MSSLTKKEVVSISRLVFFDRTKIVNPFYSGRTKGNAFRPGVKIYIKREQKHFPQYYLI